MMMRSAAEEKERTGLSSQKVFEEEEASRAFTAFYVAGKITQLYRLSLFRHLKHLEMNPALTSLGERLATYKRGIIRLLTI